VALPTERTAVFGVSAGGELALALGLRHPHVYGAVSCASPGGGYKPPGIMPSPLSRTYLVAGTQEPFFLENTRRWAEALRDADADVVMNERAARPWSSISCSSDDFDPEASGDLLLIGVIQGSTLLQYEQQFRPPISFQTLGNFLSCSMNPFALQSC
jgi:pimeloyl-ACP methyl ester carboxylesterase